MGANGEAERLRARHDRRRGVPGDRVRRRLSPRQAPALRASAGNRRRSGNRLQCCSSRKRPRRPTTTCSQGVRDFFDSDVWLVVRNVAHLLRRRVLARARVLGLQGRQAPDRGSVADRGRGRARDLPAVPRAAHLHALPAARVPRRRARARARDPRDRGVDRPRRAVPGVPAGDRPERSSSCPICTTKLRQACRHCRQPLEPVWQICPYCETPVEQPTSPAISDRSRADRLAWAGRRPEPKSRSSDRRERRVVERTLVLIKPDAVQRGLVGRILDRFEQRGLTIRGGEAPDGRPGARRAPLRRAQREAVLRRARRVHHLVADARARAGGRGRDRASCARRWARRTRRALRLARFAATSRWRCRTTSSTARTRRSRPSARSRSGSRPMSSSDGLTEHARRNRAAWDADAANWVEPGERALGERRAELGHLGGPGVRASRAARCRREGRRSSSAAGPPTGRPGSRDAAPASVGIDNSEHQLETARRAPGEHGLEFPLLHGIGEEVPLPDAGFDLAFSEYGACLWCDPYLWIPEAARLLRPGGQLIFLGELDPRRPLLARRGCRRRSAAARPLRHAPLRVAGRGRSGVPPPARRDDPPLERHGFQVLNLVELQAPEGGDPGRHDWLTLDWARRWPSEEIWVASQGVGA